MGTAIKPTTHLKRRTSGAFTDTALVQKRVSGAWSAVASAKRYIGGVWTMIYSTPDVSVGGGGASTSSGASTSGSASVGGTSTPGGTNSGSLSYSWAYVSGDGAISINNSALQNPTFSRAFSGVSNGTTSSGVSAVWRCTLTDSTTGAQVFADLTVGPLAWQNTIPAFTAHTDTFATLGSGSVSQWPGASTVTIYIVGGGGQGGAGQFLDGDHEYGGGGAGNGGLIATTVAAAGFSFFVGNEKQDSSVTGVGTATHGSDGVSASGADGAGGSGGSPGGTVGTGGSGGSGGAGAGAQSTPSGDYGAGGDGGGPFSGGVHGQQGVIVFVWNP